MIYRELGKTGKKVSIIGLGGEHIDRKPYEQVKATIDTALDFGVNIIDVFMPGREIRENISKAMGTKRNSVMIMGHIGSTDINQMYDYSREVPIVRKYFEELLRFFGGYIDFGVINFIDNEKEFDSIFNTDLIRYVEHLKEQGDIGHIGFSSHNPDMVIKAINTGIPEMLLFSINPAFDMLPAEEYIFDYLETELPSELYRGIDPKRAEIYKFCSQKNIGITVMKAFAAGKLLSPQHTPFSEPLTTTQCIHYALSKPAVASVLPGCASAEEVKGVMEYLDADETLRDYSAVLSSVRNDFRGSCVYCSHCQPCPVGIDIASVTRCLDVARLDTENIPASILEDYKNIPNAGECTGCGSCEERCPFGAPVIGNMEEAERLLRV